MRPWFSLALAIVLISTTPLLVKWAGHGGVSGPVSAFYRMAFATVALLPSVRFRRSKVVPGSSRAALLAGLLLAMDLALWNSSLLELSTANAALLANNAPIWVGLLAWATSRQPLGHRYWMGLVLALAGSAVLVASSQGPVVLNRGAAYAILSSLLYAGYLHFAERARSHMDPAAFVSHMSAIGALALIVLCVTLRLPLSGFNLAAWMALAGMGLISHLGGWLAGSYALGYIPAATASVVMLLQTPLTALAATVAFGESISSLQLCAGGLVLTGVALVVCR